MVKHSSTAAVTSGVDTQSVPPAEVVAVCPLCRSRAHQPLFGVQDRMHRLPGQFALVRCTSCHLIRLSPRPLPEQLGYYYPEAEYYSYQLAEMPNPALEGRRLLRWLRDGIRQSVLAHYGYPVRQLGAGFRLLQPFLVRGFQKRALYSLPDFPRYVPQGRALELGCGSGIFLACLQRHGWQVVGTELSEQAAHAAKQKWGIEVLTKPLGPETFAPESFDYIHLSDVIEHLPDPLDVMKLLARLLKPGATVFLQTPNEDSFGFRYWQTYWAGCEAPRHLYLFSPATLQRTLHAAGLKVRRTQTLPLLPGRYATELTYCNEAAGQSVADTLPRFHLRPRDWPKSRWLTLAGYIHWLRQPLRGEVIRCWAVKE